jgi:hypothetical protein
MDQHYFIFGIHIIVFISWPVTEHCVPKLTNKHHGMVFLETSVVTHLIKKFPAFNEQEGSVLCLQKSDFGP